MKLSDFLDKVKNLPPDTVICVAELGEAFAANVAEVELVEDAQSGDDEADGTESIELGNGSEKVVVIRW